MIKNRDIIMKYIILTINKLILYYSKNMNDPLLIILIKIKLFIVTITYNKLLLVATAFRLISSVYHYLLIYLLWYKSKIMKKYIYIITFHHL